MKNLMPSNIDEVIEFTKITEILSGLCAGEGGKNYFVKAPLIFDYNELKSALELLKEWSHLKEEGKAPSVSAYYDISDLVRYAHISDYVYERELILATKLLLEISLEIDDKLKDLEADEYPFLIILNKQLNVIPELLELLEMTFDEEGSIRKNASPELNSLHRLYGSKQREADRKFADLLKVFQSQSLLTDNKESYRNGRRVLSVPAEYKRRIKGIIHDESASGKTCFIEPDELISVNNDLFDIQQSITREEHKILKKVSAEIAFYAEELSDNFDLISQFDSLQARFRWAKMTESLIPELLDKPGIELKAARHPLLQLKYTKEGREVVPLDLKLDEENRILLVSGPNAGGKSVLLKSVGILQMMFQSAIPITAGEGSRLGIFSHLCADVGDQQSLEDDLSTYSSHLTNMKNFLAAAGSNSLVLIDEFGAGTDPRIGGAIAEGILRRLRFVKSFGVITTHYGNLKIYGNNASGIINGAMIFDRKNMKPTYQFAAGKPGSSFGFEIAEKVGIHPSILKYAQQKAGKKIEAVDGMLADLQKEKNEVQKRLKEIESREEEIKQKSKNFDYLYRELEIQRKKLKLSKQQIQLASGTRLQKELEEMIKELRKERDLKKAEQVQKEFKNRLKVINEEKNEVKEELLKKEFDGKVDWERVQYAKLRDGSEIAKILKVNKKKAELLFGSGLRMQVHLRELVPAKEPVETQKEASVKKDISYSGSGFNSNLDIRGLRYKEATDLLNGYFEKALLADQGRLEIIHGKGEGALRKALIQSVKEFPAKIRIEEQQDEEGNTGMSILWIS
ncbi:MAG: endonuclease MutS2 [Saprospirales bacterium]|nr:MAG: endonuclease MutS2 [Saprospirales bacterium]